MKKKIVGHMNVPKIGVITRIRRLNLLPRLICLLLALVVWLLIANLEPEKAEKPDGAITIMQEGL